MRAALQCAATAAVVLVQGSACADGLRRGPSTRDPEFVARPVSITSADRVRIQTVPDPDRVPLPLRGQFVGSVTDFNASRMTLVLENGQPAVLHRDLIAGLERSVDHGSRWKHVLIGTGIGVAMGALAGVAGHDDTPSCQGELLCFQPTLGEDVAIGAILFGLLGSAVGSALPAGQAWERIPLERVSWSKDAVPR